MRRPLFLCLPLLLAACAGKPAWVNPALPKEQYSHDYAACRRYAEEQIPPSDYVEPGEERNSDPMRQVDRDDTRKRYNAYLALCMTAKGYNPTR